MSLTVGEPYNTGELETMRGLVDSLERASCEASQIKLFLISVWTSVGNSSEYTAWLIGI